jgi:hypothetical protein
MEPEDYDGLLTTTGLHACCIYVWTDYWHKDPDRPDYPAGSVLRCVRGHRNVVRYDDGTWGPVVSRVGFPGYDRPTTVVFTHPSFDGGGPDG